MSDSDQGTFHLIYAAHGSEADYRRIEADLDLAANGNRRLVLIFEDVVTLEYIWQFLDPSLRNLGPEVVFDPDSLKRNREAFAVAYGAAVETMHGLYRAWNAAPAALKETVFGPTTAFNHYLRAWAAGHGVELMREETSLEAWLTCAAWWIHIVRTDAAVARGDAATMWGEHRKAWTAMARSTWLRDADVNAQIRRLLTVERRGHDVLYVVGMFHAVNEDRLADGLRTIVHGGRPAGMIGERFVKALGTGALDEQLDALTFLEDSLQMIKRPATSMNDLTRLIDKAAQAIAPTLPLRQIVDQLIAFPSFQEASKTLHPNDQRRYLALMFVSIMVDSGAIDPAEAEEYLHFSRRTS